MNERKTVFLPVADGLLRPTPGGRSESNHPRGDPAKPQKVVDPAGSGPAGPGLRRLHFCRGPGDLIGGKEAYAPSFYSNFIFVSLYFYRPGGRSNHRLHRCRRRLRHYPGADGRGGQRHPGVGTDLFHIFAKAIMGTAVHQKFGNVSVKLAISFLVGSAVRGSRGRRHQPGLIRMDPVLRTSSSARCMASS